MSQASSYITVGGLLPRDLLERVAAADPKLAGIDPTDYGLVPGERLNDAVTRSWNRLTAIWGHFRVALDALPPSDQTATALTRERWLKPLLDELGFAGLPVARNIAIDGKTYAISHEWGGSVPVHLPGARISIDRITRGIPGASTTSPHGLVQEFLNRSDEHLWGLVSNGLVLRVLRDNASMTRQAFVEFDLEAMFDGDDFAAFVVLWLVAHRTRFEGEPPEKCLLEQWSAEAVVAGTRALDKLRNGVERAIEALGEGFLAHPGNSDLREALRSGDLSTTAYQHQLLRTIYRMLFLLVAESRDLLLDPKANETARARYREFYSIDRVRQLATKRRGTAHDDLWSGLGITMSALGSTGIPALGVAPLGSFLWSADAIADLDDARLDNRHLLEAIRSLCVVRDDEGRIDRAVDYAHLGSEELGSIYESLLELHPQLDVSARTFRLATAAGNERKTTGSYYTPTSLITELLDSALDPVLEEAARENDPEAALLAVSVLDPACGSGHFLIAAANRIAQRLASVRVGGIEPSPAEVTTALRDVVGHCVHGIDINPMAVELCKVSLWLEAMEPGRPLNFLDHRIVCGNALLGTTPRLLAEGLPDEAFKPLVGDDKKVVSKLKKQNKHERVGNKQLPFGPSINDLAGPLSQGMAAIDALPDDTVEQVAEKERRLAELLQSAEANRARVAADAWCAAFVAPKSDGEPVITSDTIRRFINQPDQVVADVVHRVSELAEQYNFLHLHLAFPDVITAPTSGVDPTNERTGWSGGFSVVLGNPPWDMVQLSEKEWFAERDPEIAAASGAKRKRLIGDLVEGDPSLYDSYLQALRQVDSERRLLSSSGRYPLCGRGKINTYSVFSEMMRDLIDPTGRVGAIVPSGIATDNTTSLFFQDLVERQNLISLFELENVGFFAAGQGHMVRFVLLTLTGDLRPSSTIDMLFQGQSLAELADEARRFQLTPQDLKLLNPNTVTCPIFRTSTDARINRDVYSRVPILIREGSPDVSPWGLSFRQGLFNMTSDSGDFRTLEELEATGMERAGQIFVGDSRFIPIYEAKMFGQWDHRWGSFPDGGSRPHQLPEVDGSAKTDPCRQVQSFYWIAEEQLVRALASMGGEMLLVWRKITDSRASARTGLFALLPRVGVSDSASLMITGQDLAPLAAVLNSFVCDYLIRQKVAGTNFTFNYARQVPVPSPDSVRGFEQELLGDEDWFERRAIELSMTSWDMVVSAPSRRVAAPFIWDIERRSEVVAEVDAACFRLYGIERDDVDYIMESFPIVKRKDEAEHGEYRTKRLILEIYDRMAEAEATGEPYQTLLDPPPADPSLQHDPSTRPDWADLYLELAQGDA